MKTLALIVDGKSVGELPVQDVRGSGWDTYPLSRMVFVIYVTTDQAQEMADIVTHQVSRALACHA